MNIDYVNRQIPESSPVFGYRRDVTDLVIFHTAVADWNGKQAHDFFARSTSASCNFYVDWEGEITCIVDPDFEAFTSGAGSSRSIGIETAGWGNDYWSEAQIDALARLTAWACKKYNIPLQLVPDSREGRRGVAWHRLGVPANYLQKLRRISQTGGEMWSSSVGKVCPGDKRITQVPRILELAKQYAAGAAKTQNNNSNDIEEEITMFMVTSAGGHVHLLQDGAEPAHVPDPQVVKALLDLGVPMRKTGVTQETFNAAWPFIKATVAASKCKGVSKC